MKDSFSLYRKRHACICNSSRGAANLHAAIFFGEVGAVLPHGWTAGSPELLHSGCLLCGRLLDQIQKLLSPANTLHHDCHHLWQ